MEQNNPPLRMSNISDIKAKVQEMIGQGSGAPSATPGGYAYTLYEGDSSTNSITLSDSAFNYDKLVIEGYYMAMGSTAMNIAVTTEWPANKDYRKFQFTTSDLATGNTPSLTTTTDVWEVSEDGMDLDLVLALQGVDTDNIVVTPETTSQITITKVTGFNTIKMTSHYVVPYFDGGEYGAIAYLDKNNKVAYYTATSANDIRVSGGTSSAPNILGVMKTLPDGTEIRGATLLAYSIGSATTSIPYNFLYGCHLLQALYGLESSSVTSIDSYFLGACYNFNQILTFPSTLKTIGNRFLFSCISYNQPVTIPNTVTTVGYGFMSSCYSFNQPIDIADGVKVTSYSSLGTSEAADGFLPNCYSFNQPFRMPTNWTQLPNGAFYNCNVFNSPIVFSPIMISFGTYFLANCTAFNQPLTIPSTVTTLPNGFLYNCTAFNQPLTIPSGVTTVGTGISSTTLVLYNMTHFLGPLTIETLLTPTSAWRNVLATTSPSAPCYTTGVTLAGPGAETWKNVMPDYAASPYRKLILAEEVEEPAE